MLAQFVEADRILYGSGLIGTELAGPGVCVSKPEKGIQMHFGAVHNNPKADAAGKALEACFQAGGCNASFDEDVRPYIWKKVIANSGYNGVSAVMRLKVKETFADPYGHDIVMHVWKEGCAVAQALGIGDLWPLMEKEEPNIVANLGNYYPSMAQDAVLHQRQTEISVLNGAIARYGERLGMPTPHVFSPYAKTPPVPCTGGVRYGCFVYRQRRALTGWDISAPARPRAPSNLWPA